MALFQGKNGGVPFPRNENEWLEKGLSPEQAAKKVADDVFGHGHQVDAKGRPIETGRGSARNPTAQSKQALEIAAAARAAARSKIGYSPSLEGAFDPRTGK
jgi:hypothetical protein